MFDLPGRLVPSASDARCGCDTLFENNAHGGGISRGEISRGDTLVVDADSCEGDGNVVDEPACRATVIDKLTERNASKVSVTLPGLERVYEGQAAEFLSSAGRFVERVSVRDERLAERARENPLAAGREAMGRADAVADIVQDVGLSEFLDQEATYATLLAPYEGPTASHWRVESSLPPETKLADVRHLETGAIVRRYTDAGPDRYHLDPLEARLAGPALDLLARAYDKLATGDVQGGDRAPARAIRAVIDAETEPKSGAQPERNAEVEVATISELETASNNEFEPSSGGVFEFPSDGESDALAGSANSVDSDPRPLEAVERVLEKHTQEYGLLSDIFADPEISDVFLTAPATMNCLRVIVDGETLVTNVRPTARCIDGLASRFRRESGRAFSRANPTLDATATVANRRVRVAGVTDPTSEGTAFAFRVQDRDVWTLPALVANGTLTHSAAALLSVAVERGSAILTAGPRGAGKTTLLGALLWELPPEIRTVVIEDTPELPVDSLQESGRDIQALLAGSTTGELSPADALRTALRLGNGALAVGEVRGEEAAVLYEAMRIGANSEAVLGTIHGNGGAAVYDRVVNDLGVPASSFGVTDLVVTLEQLSSGRRIRCIEAVVGTDDPRFERLFEQTADGLRPTGRIDRGGSHFVESLATPAETYADIRTVLAERERLLESLSEQTPEDCKGVTASHGDR